MVEGASTKVSSVETLVGETDPSRDPKKTGGKSSFLNFLIINHPPISDGGTGIFTYILRCFSWSFWEMSVYHTLILILILWAQIGGENDTNLLKPPSDLGLKVENENTSAWKI